MPKFHVSEYFDHNSGNWSNNYKIQRIFEGRLRIFEDLALSFYRPSGRLLDVGCASGDMAAMLREKGFRITGADKSLRMVQAAKKNVHLTEIVNADINSLPFGDGVFDGELCSSVLEYIVDEQVSIRELRRVIAVHGTLLISFPNRKSIWRLIEKLAFSLKTIFGRSSSYLYYQQRQYDRHSIGVLLGENHLRVVSCSYFGSPNPMSGLWPRLAQSMERLPLFGTMIIVVASAI